MSQIQNVLLICGGKSAEHEISIRSTKNVLDALDKTKFNPIVLVIDRANHFYLLENVADLHILYSSDDLHAVKHARAYFVHTEHGAAIASESGAKNEVHLAFPVLHGTYGEDGTIQGMLEMYGIPYVGCGVAASAIAMDKHVCKELLSSYDIPVVPYHIVTDEDDFSYEIHSDLLDSKTLFVKPARLGSSVGIHKCHNAAEYNAAIDDAFKYDSKILVEAAVNGVREIEMAVLQDSDELIVSEPGELKPTHEFYSYEAKYLDPNGAEIIINANLPEEVASDIKCMAEMIFSVLGLSGMARIDFFISGDGEIYLNEVNTIPGFTSISMYPKMMDAIGITYSELITKLLTTARYEFEKKANLKVTPEIGNQRKSA